MKKIKCLGSKINLQSMDSSKMWKADRQRNTPNYYFKYKPCGCFKSNLEN